MNNTQIAEVVENARQRGIALETHKAQRFLGARELLVKQPDHKLAKIAADVVEDFIRFMSTGIEPNNFDIFLLPHFKSDEELEADARTAEAYTAATAGKK